MPLYSDWTILVPSFVKIIDHDLFTMRTSLGTWLHLSHASGNFFFFFQIFNALPLALKFVVVAIELCKLDNILALLNAYYTILCVRSFDGAFPVLCTSIYDDEKSSFYAKCCKLLELFWAIYEREIWYWMFWHKSISAYAISHRESFIEIFSW